MSHSATRAQEGLYYRRCVMGWRLTPTSRRPSERLRWRAVKHFSARAYSLARRVASNGSDPRLAEELEALRALWRSLPRAERAEAADAARALAEAQAGVAPSRSPSMTMPPLSSRSAVWTVSTWTLLRSADTAGPASPMRC